MMEQRKVEIRPLEKGKFAIDLRGYTCPYPEILARRALEAISKNDVLEITLDNAPSCESIPAAAEELKHKVLGVDKLDQTSWKISIQKC